MTDKNSNTPAPVSHLEGDLEKLYGEKCDQYIAARKEADEASAAERDRAIKVCDGWLQNFRNLEITEVSAREYAVHAVEDIRDLILLGIRPTAATSATEVSEP